MRVKRPPAPGTIVIVDLTEFSEPEMNKRRPAVILSPPLKGRHHLCTIVPLSQTPPEDPQSHHLLIKFKTELPYPFLGKERWLKGDMVFTAKIDRLSFMFRRGPRGERIRDARALDAETFEKVRACVRAGLGL